MEDWRGAHQKFGNGFEMFRLHDEFSVVNLILFSKSNAGIVIYC